MTLDNPMWSLVHELRISVIFPLLAFFSLGWPRLTLGVCLVIYGASVAALPLIAPDTVTRSLAETPQYLLMFAVGVTLAKYRAQIGDWIGGRSRLLVAGMWLTSLVLLMAPVSKIALSTLGFTLGAAGLIALAISPRAKVLSAGPLRWLGKVSFSLYLTHLLVLLSVFHLLNGKLPAAYLFLIVIAASLLIAEVFHNLVERPSMKLGRKIMLGEKSQLASTSAT